VVNAVGKRNARYLALTTTRIDAATALAMGMVQRVTTLEALDAEVDRVVSELVAGGPGAQQEIKHLMDQLSVAPITAEVRELTASTIARVRGTDEAREGFAAFLGKRPAKWIPQ
jgi:methylglutaconyl-CoA hydratase